MLIKSFSLKQLCSLVILLKMTCSKVAIMFKNTNKLFEIFLSLKFILSYFIFCL